MAFPTTGVLDTFNRANQNPIGPPWVGPIFTAGANLQIFSNALRPTGSFGGAYLPGPYGPNSEAWAVVKTPSATQVMQLLTKFVPVAVDDPSYFSLWINGSGTWQLWKKAGNVDTQLGANFAGVGALAAGDSIGVGIVGDELTAYFKPAAGSWSAQFSRTNASFSGVSGGIGAVLDLPWEIETLGGGTIVSGDAPTPVPPMFHGRGAC